MTTYSKVCTQLTLPFDERSVSQNSVMTRFLSCHGVINNLFRIRRHLMKSITYRFIRDTSFVEWNRVSYVQNLAQVIKLSFNSTHRGNLTVP
jgi:hypothetical protein